MSTWSTDEQVWDTDALAYTAMTAYSAARVSQGRSAVTDLEVQRTEAQRQLRERLLQRGIRSEDITRTTSLATSEIALTLALLFEAVGQFAGDGTPDLYMQRARFWRKRLDDEVSRATPVLDIRAGGASFEFDRG